MSEEITEIPEEYTVVSKETQAEYDKLYAETRPKLNLFTNHFQCGNAARQKELDQCLKINTESGLFSEIINFDGRITYDDFFGQTAFYPDDINILANADIYFNETIKLALRMKDNECYCITRWEEDGKKIVRFRDKHDYNKEAKEDWSQDVWIIRGQARKMYGEFELGRRGCDNRIAHEFMMANYVVTNPCAEIQCIHKHKDHTRNYTITKPVPKPYKFIPPGDEVTIRTRRKAIR